MNLVDILLILITLIIGGGGLYLITFLNNKLGSEKMKNYYEVAKTIVMSIEQLYPEFSGVDKKDLAINKLVELTNNKLSYSDAETLIEASVYEVKKILSENLYK